MHINDYTPENYHLNQDIFTAPDPLELFANSVESESALFGMASLNRSSGHNNLRAFKGLKGCRPNMLEGHLLILRPFPTWVSEKILSLKRRH